MMVFSLPIEINAVNIVLLGSFNPSIFHPVWFKANRLIRDEEAEAANLEVTHPEVSAFSIDWFKLRVFKDRFVVETSDMAHFEALRDLVLSIFSLLEHTPVSKMGLNRLMHFRMPSQEKWHAFGHLIAPKGPWKGIMMEPGLRSFIMEDQRKETRGYVRVKIEPSVRIQDGIYIEINNHYEAEIENGLKTMMGVLKDSWSEVLSSSEKIADHLLSLEY